MLVDLKSIRTAMGVLAVNGFNFGISWMQCLDGAYRVAQFVLVLGTITFTAFMIRKSRLEICKTRLEIQRLENKNKTLEEQQPPPDSH